MAITLSQQAVVTSSGAAVDVPFASANAGGGLLTLAVRSPSTIAALTGVQDSAGNTWALAVQSIRNNGPQSQLWYAPNAAGSTNTVVAFTAVPTGVLQFNAHEWAGCSTSAPLLSVSAGTSTSASTHTPGSVQTDVSSAVFLVGYAFASGFDIPTDPTGYTALNASLTNFQAYYKAMSSTSTENPEAVSSGSENGACFLAAFSGADAGQPPTGGSRRRRGMSMLGVS